MERRFKGYKISKYTDGAFSVFIFAMVSEVYSYRPKSRMVWYSEAKKSL